MSRIAEIPPAEQGPLMKLTRRFARRKVAQITGRETENMLAPLEAYARAPRLLMGIGMLEDATARLHRVPERLKVLAELKAATLTQCEYCIDIGSRIAHRAGVTEAQLLALPRYRDSDLFGEQEKLVLDYAVGVSSTPVDVPDELFERLRAQFDEAQLVELTNVIALENMRGRFNLALGIGSSGFTEGMVCAVPETAAAANGATSTPLPA
ncbi:MAG TPA: carboxymuconolactone decarboxylase family protein [Solirubrobacteraceae bacterium]|jgi:AhpD family alkylhydroperoxidase|nr:carboxymuconolactone decarboxylase family protein [Solirubrobacteraceae bacterium]